MELPFPRWRILTWNFLLAFFLFPFPAIVRAQFDIPTTWTNTTSSLPKDARLQITEAALNVLRPSIDTTTGTISPLLIETSANLQWAFILHDYFTNTTANEQLVSNNFFIYQQHDANFVSGTPNLNSDALSWGLVAYYAYEAYKNPLLLSYAKVIWDTMSLYFITPADAAAGKIASRNVSIPSSCNGSTTAGGIFWIADTPNDLSVTGQTIGPFAALSAYLFEETGNMTYSTYAGLASSFIERFMFDGQIILDTVNLSSCIASPASFAFTYNSGFTIEAWSVLANVTQNATLKATLDDLIAGSIKSPVWTNAQGVISETGSSTDANDLKHGYKAFFIRGLHTAWRRGDPTSDVAKLIVAFITSQFNALLTQAASAPQPNIYSPNWVGSPASTFQPWPQVIALHVFNAAFDIISNFTNSTNPGNSTGNTNPSNSDPPSNRSDVGAIVGGVVGGVVAVAAVLFLAFLWRRRRRQANLPVHEIDPAEARVEPWMGVAESEPFVPPPSAAAAGSRGSTPGEKHRTPAMAHSTLPRTASGILSPVDSDSASRSYTQSSSDLRSGIAGEQRADSSSAAEFRQLSEQVQGLIQALAVQNSHRPHPEREDPPSYEPRLDERV